ncbi:unnamed protein product [Clonostachys chloroleuca]|uniref:Major facilitator superfamily (MFS) profile domain-containing protein n=1 Tax=Clonostachys chloroleuca TaxID=1926264 RepID=A0AA35M4T0_9HYPO|nr:unnamed protein product [Clonostachys chloroleuca]
MASETKPAVESTVAATSEKELDNAHHLVAGITLLDVLNKWQLVLAWIGLLLVSFTNYLDSVTVSTYFVYALSEFERLSVEGALSAIFGVIALGIQGVLATLAGEIHSFTIVAASVCLITLAFILEASAPGIAALIAGFSIYAVGLMTSKFMIYVLTAELSNMRHRALSLGAANLPAMISQLGGAKMAESVLQRLSWRWGIALWCIMIPVASIPLLVALFLARRKVHQKGTLERPASRKQRVLGIWAILLEQDLIGCAFLAAGCALLFLPIPLEHGGVERYASAHCVAPTVIGLCVLIAFGIWEAKFALNPLFPKRLIRNKNVLGPLLASLCGGFSLSFLLPYFYVYIMVTSQLSISSATYVTLALTLTNAFAQLCYGALVSWMQRPKWLFVANMGLLVLGGGLQLAFPDPHSQLAGLVAAQIVSGFGFGGFMSVLVLAQASALPQDVPVLSAAYIILANFSTSVAGAVAGGMWTTILVKNLEQCLPSEIKDQARAIMGSLTVAQSYEWGSPERNAIILAHKKTFRHFFVGFIVTGSMAFLFSFICDDIHVGKVDEERSAAKRKAEEKENPQAP